MRATAFRLFAFMCLLCPGIVAGGSVQPYDLDDPSEPWRTSRSGVTRKIMPPYTPLVHEERTVSSWGRTHTFDGLFPSQVVSQDQDLLHRPIELQIKQNGQWTSVQAQRIEFGASDPDRVEFEASGAVGPIRITAASWIEYDGLIRTDLTLDGESPVTIDGLKLVFALRPYAAILHHLNQRWLANDYARSPAEPGAKSVYPWRPLVWVGNHDVGFTVVTETSNGWTSAGPGAIVFERLDDHLTLTLNIVTASTRLDDKLTYGFGLMATPCKPMRKDRFGIQIGAMPGGNLTTSMHGKNVHKHFSYPQPSDFDAVAEMISRNLRDGVRHCYYITTSSTGAKSEVKKRHHEDWVAAKVIMEGSEWTFGQPPLGADAACPASSFADFMAWAVENVMTTFPDNYGIYIDNPGPYFCENARHGCGAGGKKTYPYFSLRDLHKRIYAIVRTHQPDGIVWEHTSENFNPLQLAWIDVYSDGEHWRDAKRYPKKKVLELFNLPYMEITGSGHQVGAVPAFLSSMGTWRGDWAHWLLSRTMPFGQMMTVYHGWIDGTPDIAVARARNEFGLGREPVRFYRPHELPPWFPVDGDNVLACLWERERDRALLVVLANWGDEPVVAKMKGASVIQRLGPVKAVDALTGTEIGRPAEYLMSSIPANSFRMIRIEAETE